MFIYIIYLFIYVSICLYIYRGIVEVLSCRMVMGYRKAPPGKLWLLVYIHPSNCRYLYHRPQI